MAMRNSKKIVSKLFPEKKELFVDSMKLPKDIFYGASILTVTGNQEIWIENYKGILEYTEQRICLQAKHCVICICGENLCIQYYTNEDMKITGLICQIQYQNS